MLLRNTDTIPANLIRQKRMIGGEVYVLPEGQQAFSSFPSLKQLEHARCRSAGCLNSTWSCAAPCDMLHETSHFLL